MTQQGKSRKRERAIEALLSQPTIEKAAKASELSKRTLLRWLADPDFQREYRHAKAELLSGAINRLRSSATQFVATLEAIAKSEGKPAAARVTAARAGLELLLKASEVEDLWAEIERLKQIAGDGR